MTEALRRCRSITESPPRVLVRQMSDLRKIKSVSSFLKRIRQLRKKWEVRSGKELWFRGESREYDTPLRPELYRPAHGSRRIRSTSRLLKVERHLYEAFQRLAVQFVPDESRGDDWEWTAYFLMQHHGAPTRLLDWSDGALMALHFAVRNDQDDDVDAIVYVLEPDSLVSELTDHHYPKARQIWRKYVEAHPSLELSPDSDEDCYIPNRVKLPPSPMVLTYDHLTRRIAAQRSQFIVFGADHGWLSDRVSNDARWIDRIRIDAHHRVLIRQELRDSGVTESVIFPDLDGVGRELGILWQDLRRNGNRANGQSSD